MSILNKSHFHDEAEAFVKRSEEHTSELQSLRHLVCRLLLEKKKDHYEAGGVGGDSKVDRVDEENSSGIYGVVVSINEVDNWIARCGKYSGSRTSRHLGRLVD